MAGPHLSVCDLVRKSLKTRGEGIDPAPRIVAVAITAFQMINAIRDEPLDIYEFLVLESLRHSPSFRKSKVTQELSQSVCNREYPVVELPLSHIILWFPELARKTCDHWQSELSFGTAIKLSQSFCQKVNISILSEAVFPPSFVAFSQTILIQLDGYSDQGVKILWSLRRSYFTENPERGFIDRYILESTRRY